MAYLNQGYISGCAAKGARAHGIQLELLRLLEVNKGIVLWPQYWMVERSIASITRFRRLLKNYKRCASTLADM